jgi:hypothetical protein
MSQIEEKYDIDEDNTEEYIDYLEDDDNTPYIEKNKTDAIGLYNAFEDNNENNNGNSNSRRGGKKKRKTNRRKTNRRKTNRRKTNKIIK